MQSEKEFSYKEEKVKPRKNPTVLVCIQRRDEHGVHGMLVSPCKKKPEAFSGLGEMILKLDDLSSQDSGPFWKWDVKDFPYRSGEFLEVQVKRRMYGSLQGLVRGKTTGNRYKGFKSALELMRMVSGIDG